MPSIRVKEHETFESAVRRFKRAVEKSGILSDMRKREFYRKPSSVRKIAHDAAIKRHRKKQQREQLQERGGDRRGGK